MEETTLTQRIGHDPVIPSAGPKRNHTKTFPLIRIFFLGAHFCTKHTRGSIYNGVFRGVGRYTQESKSFHLVVFVSQLLNGQKCVPSRETALVSTRASENGMILFHVGLLLPTF